MASLISSYLGGYGIGGADGGRWWEGGEGGVIGCGYWGGNHCSLGGICGAVIRARCRCCATYDVILEG